MDAGVAGTGQLGQVALGIGEGMEQGLGLGLRDGEHGAVAWREDAAGGGVLHGGEVLEVGAGTELVVAAGIAVVHQNPGVLVDELEDAGALDGHVGLLECARGSRPLAAERLAGTSRQVAGRDLADAALALVLVEAVIERVGLVVDDVHVDGGRAAVVEIDGLTLEVGEVGVGIAVEVLVVGDALVAGEQREIDHELACLGVPDGLGSPDAGDLLEHGAAILRGEVDGGVLPVDEVAGLHEHEAAVAGPSLGRAHVGVDHIEHAVGAAQDVGIAHAALQGDGVGLDDGLAAVDGGEVVAVVGEGVVEVLVVVGGEIDEEIVGVGLALVERDCEIARLTGFSLDDGSRERDGAFLALRKL